MTLSPEQFEERKALTLKVLNVFMDYCRKHNLRFYAAYGTALGTVRHHGFIPWDDDVDLYMPRPDYEKLKQLYATDPIVGYDLLTPEQTPDYPLTFSKFSLHEATLFEAPYIRCNMGIFIDLFPLDGSGNGEPVSAEKVRRGFKLSTLFTSLSARMRVQDFLALLKKGELRQFASLLLLQCNRASRRKKTLEAMNALTDEIPFDTASHVMNFQYSWQTDKQVPKEWLDDWEEVPFEDSTIRVFKAVHQYLTKIYGDYMTPPPKDKQVTHHSYYKYNPHQREEWS